MRNWLQVTCAAAMSIGIFSLSPVLSMLAEPAPVMPELELEPPPSAPVVLFAFSDAAQASDAYEAADHGIDEVSADEPDDAAEGMDADGPPVADAADGAEEVQGIDEDAGESAGVLMPRESAAAARIGNLTPTVVRRRTRVSPPVLPGRGGKTKKTRKKKACLEPVPEIIALGHGTYQVERHFVDDYATHIKKLDTLGYVKQHKPDEGRSDGMLLRGVRCGNALHQAGLRSGDVIHTVNGRKVRSIAAAILTYTTQRRKKVVEVEITRREKRMRLTYHVT